MYLVILYTLMCLCGLYHHGNTLSLGRINVARNKITNQSSTVVWPVGGQHWSSDRAVDGQKQCRNGSNVDFSGTGNEYDPWWQVDLGKIYTIDKIIVYGRRDNIEQLKGFRVNVTGEDTNLNVYTDTNYSLSVGHVVVQLVYPMSVQYVKIDLPGTYRDPPGRTGPLVVCEVEVYTVPRGNLIELINSTTYMSSTFMYGGFPWDSTKAIDGRMLGHPDTCQCCSGTHIEQSPWWQIDLHYQYLIDRIEIFGRMDGSNTEQYSNLEICISNTTFNGAGKPGFIVSQLPNMNLKSNVTLPEPRLFKNLIIRKTDHQYLTICEVKIYRTECSRNRFGDKCSQTCHCSGGRNCTRGGNDSSMRCDLCAPGWIGDSCETPCDERHFGQNCSQTCSGNCKGGYSNCNQFDGNCTQGCIVGYKGVDCNKACDNKHYGDNCTRNCNTNCKYGVCDGFDGTCTNGCGAGYAGANCSQTCDNSFFGENCANRCHCNVGDVCSKNNGSCPNGCDFGWSEPTCSKECDVGQFGASCSHACHCSDNKKCHQVTGTCSTPGCYPGWNGTSCDQECVFPLFGHECNQTCHCISGTHCDHVSGKCDEGLCDPGWQPESCRQECRHGHFGDGCMSYCHCINNSTCDHINGTCYDGSCEPGWQGDACDAECSHGRFGKDCLSYCQCVNNSSCDHINGTCHAGLREPGGQGDARDAEMNCKESTTDTRTIIVGVVIGVINILLIGYSSYITLKLRRANLNQEQSRTSPNVNKQTTYVNQEFENIAMPDNSVEDSDNTESVYTSLNDETRAEKSK